jgi:hypothetical protein
MLSISAVVVVLPCVRCGVPTQLWLAFGGVISEQPSTKEKSTENGFLLFQIPYFCLLLASPE